jgi:hypothetical protein
MPNSTIQQLDYTYEIFTYFFDLSDRIVQQFQNNAEIAEYSSVIDRAISKGHSRDAMSHDDALKKSDAIGNGGLVLTLIGGYYVVSGVLWFL